MTTFDDSREPAALRADGKRDLRRALPKVALLFFVCGCSSKTPPASTPPKATPVDPWIITNLDPWEKTSALLWNGLVGVRVSAKGKAGGPMFSISKYEQTGEEKILPQANPLDGTWSAATSQQLEDLHPDTGGEFKQQLNLKNGTVTSTWTQKIIGANLKVKVETNVHPDAPVIDQTWTIESDAYVDLRYVFLEGKKLTNTLEAQGKALYSWPGFDGVILEYDMLGPENRRLANEVNPRAAWALGDVRAAADKGKPFTYRRLIEPIVGPFHITRLPAIPEDAKEATEKMWQTDIEIDGPVEDQQFIRTALFYLRGAVHPQAKMSVSPMSLSSDIYNGHVFWDADIWVFPALALIDPERAKAIATYRLQRSHEFPGGFNKNPGYGENMSQWLKDERPIGRDKLGKPTQPFIWPEAKLKVSWESSVSGRETVPGPSRFQDHITGSVWFMLQQASALGVAEPAQVSFFTRGATDFYLQRITKRPDGQYDLKNTMSPDEHHTGDNDLYTNLLAQAVLKDGLWKAKDSIPKLYLPKDDKTFLTYDNDGLRSYKQAAAVLSIYPLQYPPAEAQAKQMMERFSDKVIKNGPAMTDSIHALIWARVGEKEKAYKAWHDSWQPFVKPPFLLFSEKRNSSRTYFTTGAAGSLQTVLYGFAGLRIDDKKAPNSQWAMPLKNEKVISIAPSLPKEWKKLTLRNLTILGKKYTFEIENDKVKVTVDPLSQKTS